MKQNLVVRRGKRRRVSQIANTIDISRKRRKGSPKKALRGPNPLIMMIISERVFGESERFWL